MPQYEPLLTAQEVAEWFGVSVWWVHDHSSGRRGVQMPSIKVGRFRRFRRSDVEKWLDQVCRPADARLTTSGRRDT